MQALYNYEAIEVARITSKSTQEELKQAQVKYKNGAISVELFNKADGLIFQTEKQLKEFGDKLSADKKAAIETAVAELKTAFEAKDADATKTKTEALDAAWMAASEELYAAGQQAQGAEQAQGNPAGNSGAAEDVQDADFEEVK